MRFVLVGLLFCAMATAVSGQVRGRVEVIGFQNLYRPDCWTPMVVSLRPETEEDATYQIQVHQKDIDGDVVIYTALMAVTQGGGTTVLIGVLITYAVVQFFQSYVLEPLVVGSNVNINPLFTIIALIGGELLWGIAGMVLAIPLLGIFKILCDHIEPLKPYGYLIGGDEKGGSSRMAEKLRGIFRKK